MSKTKIENTKHKDEVLGPWKIAWQNFCKNKVAVGGLILFILILLAVIFIPIIINEGINDYNLTGTYAAPSGAHWFGTDAQGRDVLLRLFTGGRISVLVGIIAAAITVLLGSIVGGVAGFYGGIVDNILMRISEIISSLPFTPIIIALAAVMMWVDSELRMYLVMLLIGILSWPGLARLIRGQILSLREQEFMQACEALGLSDFSKIFKHLIPNVISIVIVNATLSMASAILTEASLSFLGMGVIQPTPTWGNMMNSATNLQNLQAYPWTWLPAGIMVLLTVVSINLIGEGLRDAFDPKNIS